jgi:hypothetical protein
MSKDAINLIIWHYRSAITLTENMQKISGYLSENRRIIWLDDGYNNAVIQYVEDFLNYLNTKDLGKKPFIANSDITKKYTDAIEIASIDDEIDPQAIYIFEQGDLPDRDKRYADFAPVLEVNWLDWRIRIGYSFKGE